jgi:BlaI family penicillinase repressor
MPDTPRISESEWKIMAILWEADAPTPAYDIIQRLTPSTIWQPKTIKTMLARLVKKGALGYKKYKNLYTYFPLISESECLKAESESFLSRCFHGSLTPMLKCFVEENRLTASEIEELKEILTRSGK